MSIAANKIQHMRCALCINIQSAIMAKRHNNANIIVMGERTTNRQEAVKMVQELIIKILKRADTKDASKCLKNYINFSNNHNFSNNDNFF